MIELQFLNRILDKKDFSIVSENNINDSYFVLYKREFNFIKDHFEKYNAVPDKETFIDKFEGFDFIEVNEPDEYLLKKLKEQYTFNVVAPKLNKMAELAQDGKTFEAIEYFQTNIAPITKTKDTKCVDLINDAADRFNKYIERTRDFNKFYHKTGLPELDEIIGGWDAKEELALVLARTNVGKTWWLIYFALQSAKQGLKVGLYSGEMTEEKIGYRLDTFLFNISNWSMTHGDISIQNTYEKAVKNIKDLVPGSIKVITPAQLDGSATVSNLRSFIEKEDLDILYVDQYSLLSDERGAKNPVEAFSNISKDLKLLQVLKKIPIIVVAQLSRAENETTDGPGMRNIAQSDRIGQDATTAIFLEQKNGKLVLTVGKARDARVGDKLTYLWDINTGKITFIPTENDGTKGSHVDQVKDEFKDDRSDDIF